MLIAFEWKGAISEKFKRATVLQIKGLFLYNNCHYSTDFSYTMMCDVSKMIKQIRPDNVLSPFKNLFDRIY